MSVTGVRVRILEFWTRVRVSVRIASPPMICWRFDFVFTLFVLSCRVLRDNQLQTLPESFGNMTVGGDV